MTRILKVHSPRKTKSRVYSFGHAPMRTGWAHLIHSLNK